MLMLRLLHRWSGPLLQLYVRENVVVLRVPKSKIQILCPDRASHWGRRAIGRRKPTWEHSYLSHNSVFYGCWCYRRIDHLVLLG